MQKKYMDLLLAQIREKSARESVRQEVEEHINEQKACYIEDGMTQDQAEEKAVADMGDPVETGSALDRIHRPKPAWGMLAMITILCAAGVILQYAAYMIYPNETMGNYYFKKQCIYAVFGLFILFGVYLIDYTRVAKYSRYLCTGILLLLFLAGNNILPIFRMNHARSFSNLILFGQWITADVLFYLYLPFYSAVLYSYRNSRKRELWKIVLYTVLPVCFAGMYAHLSVFVNVAAILLLIVVVAAAKGWFCFLPDKSSQSAYHKRGRRNFKIIACLALVCTVMFGMRIYFRAHSYHLHRIQAWLNPGAFALEEGYIGNQIRDILHTSQLIGASTGQSLYGRLPAFETDYILTYLIGTFGVAAAAVIVGIVVMLGARLLYVSVHQKNQLGMMMGLACSCVFVIQSVEYILVNLTVLPVSGLYFPLISFGGSGMLQTCILLGILLSIYRYEDVVAEPKMKCIGELIL